MLGDWLHPGQHVTAVGADVAGKRELDDDALVRTDRLYVDSIEKNLQVGDVAAAFAAGAVGTRDITAELGHITAQPPPRTGQEITIAKLVGLGVQDLAAALTVLERLDATGPARSAPASTTGRPS